MNKLLLSTTLVLIMTMISPSTQAQTPPDYCDPGLEGSTSSPQGYQPREGRCEGLYALQVNSTQIVLTSFTADFPSFDLSVPSDLVLSWPEIPKTASTVDAASDLTRIRAYSYDARTRYRMDTAIDHANVYHWPTDLLETLDLNSSVLGLIAWTERSFQDEQTKVYVPLQIAQGKRPTGTPNRYSVVIVPNKPLKEVFYSLQIATEDGNKAKLIDETPLGYFYYPAKAPTQFEFDAPPEPGFYRMQLSIRDASGSPVTTTFHFYHAGASMPLQAVSP